MSFLTQLALLASIQQATGLQSVYTSQRSSLQPETKERLFPLANHTGSVDPILQADPFPFIYGFSLMCPALALLLHFAWLELRPQRSQTPHLDAQEEAAAKAPKKLVGNSFVELFYMKAVGEDKDSVALRVWGAAKGIEHSMTYECFAKAIQSGARSLADAGIASGDRVAFYCKGTLDFWVALMSAQSIGATPVLLNWRQSKENLQIMMEDTGVTCLVVGALHEMRTEFFSVIPRNVKAVVVLDGEDTVGCPCAASRFSWHTRDALVNFKETDAAKLTRSSEALIFFTSGSTNAPKPVLHTYKTLMWAAENYVWPENATATLSFLPNFHVIMTLQNFLFPLSRGISVSIHAMDATESINSNMLLKAAAELQPTIIETVPFIMDEWSALNAQELKPLQNCTLVQSGGAPLSAAVAARLIEARVPVRQIYGQTEAAGIQLVTVPGATAYEMSVFMPPWKMATVSLENGEDEGELFIQGIESSSPGNLSKGVLIPGTCKMQPDVGHRTGDVFRWTTMANGRKGLVHCMRTDDVILLSTGEMFNPVPMEKSISDFAHGLDGVRNSQFAVLGKNRASPILVVELPANSNIGHKAALEKLQPAIDAANAAEVEYARIKPGYELILSPGESKVLLPKTAKGNFIRTKSEHLLRDMMDEVETAAKKAQAVELLEKAKAAGYDNVQDFLANAGSAEKKDLGVDSLGVAMRLDEKTVQINVICDNIKAISMCSVLVCHFYKIARTPKVCGSLLSLLVAVTETGTVDGALGGNTALGSFQISMWVFFLAFGTVDGVQDGPSRVLSFFGSRTLAVVIVIGLYKMLYWVMLGLNLVSYLIDGHSEVAPTAIWFLYLMIWYRAIVRLMQLLRFPRWLQVVVAAAVPCRYFFQANLDVYTMDVYFWPLNLMFTFPTGLVPSSLFALQGSPSVGGNSKANWRGGTDDCKDVGLGMCVASWTPGVTIWGSMFDFYGVAHVLAYYYGEAYTLWVMKRSQSILSQVRKVHGSQGEEILRLLVVVSSMSAVVGIFMFTITPILETYPQWVRASVQWLIAFAVVFFKYMTAVAMPLHAKRMGSSTLGIYILHRFFAFVMFNWVIDVSDFLYDFLGNFALTGLLQFTLLVGWTGVLCYTMGPTMQSICTTPVTKIRSLFGDN